MLRQYLRNSLVKRIKTSKTKGFTIIRKASFKQVRPI
jgi:hypothetical protein